MCGQRQRGSRQRLVYSGDGSSGSKGVGSIWSTAVMAAVRALTASGAAAAVATAARESAASGATVAMAMADGDSIRLAVARTAALGTAAARATAVGGSEQRQSMAARASAWGALVFQRQRQGLWFLFVSSSDDGSVGGFGF